jgi:mRNA interferase RelE/StbE
MNGLPDDVLARVNSRMKRLRENPRERGTRRLEGTWSYRVRVGEYRILYEIDDSRRPVIIRSVADRKDVYR